MNTTGKKVILVEDNLAEATLTRLAFQSKIQNAEIIHCANGEELFVLLNQIQLDDICYVLLDLNMPRIGGIEVLRIVGQHEKWRLLPFIIFSSSSLEQEVRACYDLGANAYVTKPMNLDLFDKTIESIHRFWGEVNLRPAIGG